MNSHKLLWIIAFALVLVPLVRAGPSDEVIYSNDSCLLYWGPMDDASGGARNNITRKDFPNINLTEGNPAPTYGQNPLANYSSKSLGFDGADDYFYNKSLGAHLHYTNFTVAFWFDAGDPTSNAQKPMATRGTSPASGWMVQANALGSSNTLEFVYTDGESETYATMGGSNQRKYGFFAAVVNTSSTTVYLNMTKGTTVASITPEPGDKGTNLTVGKDPLNAQDYQGRLDEVFIFNCSIGEAKLNHIMTYNINNTVSAGEPATPAGVNITLQNLSVHRNGLLNVSCQGFSSPTIGNITLNLTGIGYNASFSLTGASANFSQNFTINGTRGAVINATCWSYNANGGSQNSTLITVAPTTLPPPSIIKPAANTLHNVQPLHLNISFPVIVDDDTYSRVVYWINDTSRPNQTIIISGGNTGNTTFNATDGVYNLSVAYCTAFNCSSNSTIASFKIDLTNPADNLSSCFPLSLNFIRRDMNCTPGASDSNLYGHNITFFPAGALGGVHRYSAEATGITTTFNSFLIQINTSWGDGTYSGVSNESDDHTWPKIPDYVVQKNLGTKRLDFDTGKNAISFRVMSALAYEDGWQKPKDVKPDFVDIGAQKLVDRYTFSLNFTKQNPKYTLFRYTLELTTAQPLVYREGSKYRGHFISGENWIDFEGDQVNFVQVTKFSDHTYLVDIDAVSTDLLLRSIGGVNIGSSRVELEIDTGNPQFHFLNASSGGLRPNASFVRVGHLNFTYNVSDRNNQSVVFYLNGVKNISSGYRSNQSINATFNLTDGNYSILVEINDSAGNRINGSTMVFAVDSTAPAFANASNRTTSGSVEILDNTDANLSVYLADEYLKAGNISHNGSLGVWQNFSISAAGNRTYSVIVNESNLFSGQVVGWKFYAFDEAGNELDPLYTFTVGSSETPSAPAGDTGGGGGGGGAAGSGTVYTKCDRYVAAYNTCFHVDGLSCVKGCQAGFRCSGVECVQAAPSAAVQPVEAQAEELTLAQRFRLFVKRLFNKDAGLSFQPAPLAVTDLTQAEAGGSSAAEGASGAAKAKHVDGHNPYLAMLLVGVVALALALIQFGPALFTNPLALTIMVVAATIGLVLWRLRVFG